MKFMQDHAIIRKCMAIWPRESDIILWIQIKWKPKAPFDIRLCTKGFFTKIVKDLDDHKHILDGGCYFMNIVGLFMR